MFISRLRTDVAPDVGAWAKTTPSDEVFAANLDVALEVDELDAPFAEIAKRSPTARLTTTELRLGPLPLSSSEAPTEAHRAATFWIDYEEPAVRAARDELARRFGDAPAPHDVESFVHEFIAQKTHTRGLDTASEVADSRSGDCSEHAVLLAALLRDVGIPARVVFGLAIIAIDDDLLSVGHAWVEYHDDGAWHRADAALYRSPSPGGAVAVPGLPEGTTFRRAYVPLQVVRDESVGYRGAMVREFALARITGVRVGRRAGEP